MNFGITSREAHIKEWWLSLALFDRIGWDDNSGVFGFENETQSMVDSTFKDK